jgi:hypothetical protein
MDREMKGWTDKTENRELSELDSLLSAPEQRAVAEVVSQLPEDSVSMAWRSQLNERLLAAAPPVRPSRRWILRPALALGAAGALALSLILTSKGLNGSEPLEITASSLETKMIAAHRESVGYYDIAGPGLVPLETDRPSTGQPEGYDLSEVDLNAL